MSEQLQVSTLPVLYNPELVQLQEMCKQPIEMFTDTPVEEVADNYRAEPQERHSGIIEGLFYAVRFSENDFREMSRPNFTGKIRHDNVIRESLKEYYSHRIDDQAEEIVQLIHGLIQLDGWSEYRFGNYKAIKTLISRKTGRKKALELQRLRIMAMSAIPPDIKFETTEIIEPSITSPVRTQ